MDLKRGWTSFLFYCIETFNGAPDSRLLWGDAENVNVKIVGYSCPVVDKNCGTDLSTFPL